MIVFRNALVSRTRVLPAPFLLRVGFSGRSWAFGLTLLIVSYLVIVPLITLLYASIKSTEDKLPFETTATTLANYALVFSSPATLPLLLNTLLFTLGSLAIGLPLAIIFAWLLERTAVPGRTWIASLVLVPMTIPSLLSAIAWIQLLDPRIGLVNVALRGALGLSGDMGPLDIYSLGGMCFVQGLRLVPSAYLMIAASFRAMDPSLEEQSAMAGRNVAQTTLRVTLPIVRPALLAALIYYVIVVIESFDIPGLLGFTARIRVLSTAIYWATHSEVGLPDYGLASALGTIVLAVALFLMWIYHRLTASSRKICDHHGQRLSAAANQPGQVDVAGSFILFDLRSRSRGFTVRDAAMDQRAAVLCSPVRGFIWPRDFRRLSEYLARRQRRSRRLEYHHYCFGHGGGDDCIVSSCELVCRAA